MLPPSHSANGKSSTAVLSGHHMLRSYFVSLISRRHRFTSYLMIRKRFERSASARSSIWYRTLLTAENGLWSKWKRTNKFIISSGSILRPTNMDRLRWRQRPGGGRRGQQEFPEHQLSWLRRQIEPLLVRRISFSCCRGQTAWPVTHSPIEHLNFRYIF